MLRIFNKKNLHGYSIIKNAYNVALNLKIPEIRKIAQEYDSIGYMSVEVGQELDGLYTNDDYVIGIHRTGYTIMTEKMISTFFLGALLIMEMQCKVQQDIMLILKRLWIYVTI